MALAPWEVLRRGRRRRPWLSQYRWFVCVCELWFVGVWYLRMCLVFGDLQTLFEHCKHFSNTLRTHCKHIAKDSFSDWSFGLAQSFLSTDESFWVEPNGWTSFLFGEDIALYLRSLKGYYVSLSPKSKKLRIFQPFQIQHQQDYSSTWKQLCTYTWNQLPTRGIFLFENSLGKGNPIHSKKASQFSSLLLT